ncbi:MAG: ABC transporter substrate-binding protein [Alphaproteobacteria bacterium]
MTYETTRPAPSRRAARLNRRSAIKGMGALAGATALLPGYRASGSDAPIRVGFQVHRTGIGAAYGRWYEITSQATVQLINETGGIGGRPIELVIEDDGTDPKRGAEVVEKFANEHKVDVVFGTLFSHVVIGSAPSAGALKMPYFVVSEGYHVASGMLNRYVFQPGITDVRQQISTMAPWITSNLGKKIAMIFPDYAFGYDHRDFFSAAAGRLGGEITALLAMPPTETSYTKYFPQIPAGTDVIYHVMVGPGVLTFVKELGEFFGSGGPALFGFIDSLEAVDIASPGLEYLEGSHFWEAFPRYADGYPTEGANFYRNKVGVDSNGASVTDPADIATSSHMFGCWETLFAIKAAVEESGYRSATDKDKKALIEALEATTGYAEGMEHPQGAKNFVGKIHQCFGQQFISKVEGGRLNVVHRTTIKEGLYEPEADYTTQPL